VVEQALSAAGGGHRRVAVRGSVQELSADVGFEALELQVEVLGVMRGLAWADELDPGVAGVIEWPVAACVGRTGSW
jgi:hypothetical protein